MNIAFEMTQSSESSTFLVRCKKAIGYFFCGGASGVIAKTIAAPFERVRLLLLTQQYNPKLIGKPYRGTMITLLKALSIA